MELMDTEESLHRRNVSRIAEQARNGLRLIRQSLGDTDDGHPCPGCVLLPEHSHEVVELATACSDGT